MRFRVLWEEEVEFSEYSIMIGMGFMGEFELLFIGGEGFLGVWKKSVLGRGDSRGRWLMYICFGCMWD